MVCAYAKQDGRGNLRVAKTPPLQSGVCGDIIAIPMSPLPPPCAYHTTTWRATVFITGAALLGRALAPLGIAPTENIMSNPVMVRHVMPF